MIFDLFELTRGDCAGGGLLLCHKQFRRPKQASDHIRVSDDHPKTRCSVSLFDTPTKIDDAIFPTSKAWRSREQSHRAGDLPAYFLDNAIPAYSLRGSDSVSYTHLTLP